MRWWSIAHDDVPVGVAAHEVDVGERDDARERGERVVAERREGAEHPVRVGAAGRRDVAQDRVERGRVAVDVGEDG